MKRWLVELNGDRFDIAEFPLWFPNGSLRAIEDGGKVFLTGTALDTFSEPSQVHSVATQALDEYFAIISLLDCGIRKPSIGAVLREADDGTRTGAIFSVARAVSRSKLRAVSIAPLGAKTHAEELLLASPTDRRLQVAAFLLSNEAATWPHLYRCLEEIEFFLGMKVSQARICSDNQRERFTRSANAAEVAGSDARHRLGKVVPPRNPMSLQDARAFLSQVLQATLRGVLKSVPL